jgi:hypothetical protein
VSEPVILWQAGSCEPAGVDQSIRDARALGLPYLIVTLAGQQLGSLRVAELPDKLPASVTVAVRTRDVLIQGPTPEQLAL